MTFDEIKSTLLDPSVAEGFFAGKSPEVPENATYLHFSGCVFPSVVADGFLSVHAAIKPEQRGKTAVQAGKKVVEWGKSRGLKVVCRSSVNIRKDNIFAVLCGMTKIGSDERYNYYEALS